MGDEAQHPTDALQDALDHRLDSAARARLDEHLSSCAKCRRELAALQWTKDQARSARHSEEPVGLEARLRGALDEADRVAPGAASGSRTRLRRLVPWLAAAAAVVAAVWMVGRFRTSSIPDSVSDGYRAYTSNALPVEIASSDPPELERYFVERGLPFTVRVFDLGMMGFRLEGARVDRVGGRVAALVAYRGADGRVLLCRMYQGSVADLPEPIDRRTNGGITFHLYRDGEVTLVFWQEGTVVCVLAAEGDPETVIQLAFAKAVKL